MKFNHYTINTKHNYIQDTKEILEDREGMDYREYFLYLFLWVKNNPDKPIYLADDIYIKGVVEKDAYALTLEDEKGIPFLETIGAINEERVCYLNSFCENLYEAWFHQSIDIEKKSTPVVWDILLPMITRREDIVLWTGDFCRSFGAIAFEEMEKKICVEKEIN